MIDVQALTFAYRKNLILKGLVFHVEKGEIFGVLGPSGAARARFKSC